MTNQEVEQGFKEIFNNMNDEAIILLWNSLTETGTTTLILQLVATEIMKRNINLTK